MHRPHQSFTMNILDKLLNKNTTKSGKPSTAGIRKKRTPASSNAKKQPARPQVQVPASSQSVKTAKDQPAKKRLAVPEKDRQLVGDTLWMCLLVLSAYVCISLISFHMKDPSWSRNVPNLGQTRNFGGLLGAWLSDVFYYLFGLSAWWGMVAVGVWLYRHFRPILNSGKPPYNTAIGLAGLAILLLCSPVLEAALFPNWLQNRLPLDAGGLVGSLIDSTVRAWFGHTVGVVLLFAFAMLGFSLLVQISWLDFLERLGNRLERLFRYFVHGKNKEITPTFFPDKPEANPIEQIVAIPVAKNVSSRNNRKMAVTVAQRQPAPARKNLSQSVEINGYRLPDLSHLREAAPHSTPINPDTLRETGHLIEAKLAEFGIDVQVVSAIAGPVITRYEIEPAKGVKGSQIVNLSKDLARSLSVQSVRVVETIVGKTTMGIELPNEQRQEVLLQEIFSSDVFNDAPSKLTVALGKDIAGLPVVGDLAKMPHLLVGGMTGSGKSVGVNAMILSMLYKATPEEVRFIMIDPKMLELSIYEGIAHLLCPVVTDMREAGNALNWCVAEMEKRYRLLARVGVRTLAGYNEKVQAALAEGKPIPNPFSLNPDEPEPLTKLPQIVLVIDELADLMMTEKKSVETQIARLAQKARAAGIHMIIATQRPSVDVITGLIKANVPTRMAFTVQSRIDSRTILDQMGAEDLLKYGDLLFLQPGNAEPTRLQGAFVSDDEVHNVVNFIKSQAEANYIDGILTGEATQETQKFIEPNGGGNAQDELFDQAVQFVVSSRKTSISALQRHLRIGYNRAANLMQALEEDGIVSPPDSQGGRQIFSRLE